jgi:RNA polymerase sigma-70 factor (ECF subfamily)
MVPDPELVERARGGDVRAFAELVTRHRLVLYRTALAIVGSPADGEDVTQSAWLHAYRHVAHFHGAASVRTWLVAIVRNQAIDHQRVARRQLRRETEAWQTDVIHGEGICRQPSPETLVLLNERRTRVRQSIQALSSPLRNALGLWSSGQYSYEEMATITGVATGTMKSHVWAARRRVAQTVSARWAQCAQGQLPRGSPAEPPMS